MSIPSQYSKGLVNNSNRTHLQKDRFPPHIGNIEFAILGIFTAQLAPADVKSDADPCQIVKENTPCWIRQPERGKAAAAPCLQTHAPWSMPPIARLKMYSQEAQTHTE